MTPSFWIPESHSTGPGTEGRGLSRPLFQTGVPLPFLLSCQTYSLCSLPSWTRLSPAFHHPDSDTTSAPEMCVPAKAKTHYPETRSALTSPAPLQP